MKFLSLYAALFASAIPVFGAPYRYANASAVNHLVVFGDSFLDNGNGSWVVSNHTWPADPAYFEHRFSNGPVWAEDLASIFNFKLTDYAVGGATSNNSLVQGFTGPNNTIKAPSLLDQVQTYLASNETADASNSLFVMMFGANDELFDPTVDPTDIAKAMAAAVSQIQAIGGSNFLFSSYPDLGKIPFDNFLPAADSVAFSNFTQSLSETTFELAHQLDRSSNLTVRQVDTYGLFKDIFAHPKKFGFVKADVQKSCLTGAEGETPVRTLCDDPEDFVFWDADHPTAKGHQLIAKLAARVVEREFGCSRA